jgi:hemerythrin
MKIDRQLFRTGHSLIDSQHEAYLDILDELFAIGGEPLPCKIKVEEALNKAIAYGLEHFTAEEHLMESMKYPALEAHRNKHNEFRVRAEALRLAGKHQSPETFLQEINLYMVMWLRNQIQTYDKALAEFLTRRSIF